MENELNIEFIKNQNMDFAIILRREFQKEGIHFFTPDDSTQQLGYMKHPAGKKIVPHFHNPVERLVSVTQEALILKSGVLRVNFYTEDNKYYTDRILRAGDIILLRGGGHGFEVIEDVEIIEVKQGPYAGDADKTQFDPIC